MSNAATLADRPATFREVMASNEFRAVFAGSALSWFGDHAAKAAVTALVFQQTGSVAVSAATFAISYLPWIGVGSLLSAVAERHSYRRVMVFCDLSRLATMALVALPGAPVPLMMGLLFLTALLNPPFDSARSALLPRLLDGDKYIVGLVMQKTAGQTACVLGYFSGASLAVYDARLAVLFNAATFGFSAFAVGFGVYDRPPALATAQRSNLLTETADGFRVVFSARLLRSVAILIFLIALFSVAPEGLAAAWAAKLAPSPTDRGWYQGVMMMANPIGFILGSLLVGRLLPPSVRQRLIRPFAAAAPLALVPALANPNVWGVAAMNAICGFLVAGVLPPANGLFVQALPNAYRARAFGVMQGGIMVFEGITVFTTGALADSFSLPTVVGAWSVAGVIIMIVASLTWPSPTVVAAEIATAQARNAEDAAAAEAAADSTSGQEADAATAESSTKATVEPVAGTAPAAAADAPMAPAADGTITADATVAASADSGSPAANSA